MKFWISVMVLCLATANLQADERKIIRQMKSEKRVALVIGNKAYLGDLPPLRNTVRDAKSIRDILKKRGFEVIYKTDVTKKSMKNHLKSFYRKIRGGGVGVFYFSGHGIELNGQNYLIPTNADLEDKSDAEYEAVALNQITSKMQKAKNRLNIVILDACRSNPFEKSIGSGGLAKVEPIGLFVSYSTSAGKTASDGRRGENGLFTKYLIKYMKQSGLNLSDVFKKAREDVYDISEGKQFPAIYDQTIRGNFYFTLPDITTPPDPEPIYTPTFQTTPSGASMLVEGYGSWYEGMKLKKGKYDIRVSKSGYETTIYTINLSSSGLFRFSLEAKGGGSDFSFTKKDMGSYIIPAMVKINRGSFTMGSNNGRSNEKPTHIVNIGYGFYIGKYEVSVAEFRKFVNDTGYKTEAEKGDGCYVYSGGSWGKKSDANWKNPYFNQDSNHPVVCVSWNDSEKYIEWVNRKTGKNYRLLTEAEWEYVARAGTTTKWSFGDSKSSVCKYMNLADSNTNFSYKESCDDGYKNTSPVGNYRKNPWGLYDMHGNVWEWCEDWYKSDYNNAPTNGNANDNRSQYKLLRGGSWDDSSGDSRSAFRFSYYPSGRDGDIGFRLAGALH